MKKIEQALIDFDLKYSINDDIIIFHENDVTVTLREYEYCIHIDVEFGLGAHDAVFEIYKNNHGIVQIARALKKLEMYNDARFLKHLHKISPENKRRMRVLREHNISNILIDEIEKLENIIATNEYDSLDDDAFQIAVAILCAGYRNYKE